MRGISRSCRPLGARFTAAPTGSHRPRHAFCVVRVRQQSPVPRATSASHLPYLLDWDALFRASRGCQTRCGCSVAGPALDFRRRRIRPSSAGRANQSADANDLSVPPLPVDARSL